MPVDGLEGDVADEDHGGGHARDQQEKPPTRRGRFKAVLQTAGGFDDVVFGHDETSGECLERLDDVPLVAFGHGVTSRTVCRARRPRWVCCFTAPPLIPRVSAVSATVSSSRKRHAMTSRCRRGRRRNAWPTSSASSRLPTTSSLPATWSGKTGSLLVRRLSRTRVRIRERQRFSTAERT